LPHCLPACVWGKNGFICETRSRACVERAAHAHTLRLADLAASGHLRQAHRGAPRMPTTARAGSCVLECRLITGEFAASLFVHQWSCPHGGRLGNRPSPAHLYLHVRSRAACCRSCRVFSRCVAASHGCCGPLLVSGHTDWLRGPLSSVRAVCESGAGHAAGAEHSQAPMPRGLWRVRSQ